MSAGQKEQLWRDVVQAVDNGYGMVANIVAPVSNQPRGVLGSSSPNYGSQTVWHYFTVIGRDDTEARAVLIGDPGFAPFIYWISFDQLATLIPPKGWCFADVAASRVPVDDDDAIWRDNLEQLLGPVA